MNPVLLKKQLADNANDIQEFCKDLQSWGQDMKLKEASLKKPPLQPKSASNQPSKLTDYSKWDKFDAELECERLEADYKDDSDLTDEFENTEQDKALVHKQKGNSYVKAKNWAQAIECYSEAIKCYQYDPIFYANRALCHLKLCQYESAESDCTLSLRLDGTYVKALQRRAAAKEALNKLTQALTDLELVLNYEPKNAESLAAIERVKKKLGNDQQRPISKFTASRKPIITNTILKTSTSSANWPDPGCEIALVNAINKPVQLRSKKPLKRIQIVENNENEAFKRHVVERVQIVEKKPKDVKNTENISKQQLTTPKTSIQFLNTWKILKNDAQSKYEYLKLIAASEVPNIFQESMESKIFSNILEVLAQSFIKNNDNVYDFLNKFTEVKRFNALTMFMDSTDKNHLWKLIGYLREQNTVPGDQIDRLIKLYEL